MIEMDFYKLLDTYATLNNIDRNEALHQWYRGNLDAGNLLEAFLNDEGIFGYRDTLVKIIKILNAANARNGREW